MKYIAKLSDWRIALPLIVIPVFSFLLYLFVRTNHLFQQADNIFGPGSNGEIFYTYNPLADYIFMPTAVTSFLVSFLFTYTRQRLIKSVLTWFLSCLIIEVIFLSSTGYQFLDLNMLFESLIVFGFSLVYFVLPAALAGFSVGAVLSHLKTKGFTLFQEKLILIKKTLPLSLMLTIILMCITGVFINRVTLEKHTVDENYYMHRGLPFVYSGVADKGAKVSFPLIKLTIFSETLPEDGSTYYKLISLNQMALAFIFYFVLSSLVSAAICLTVKDQKIMLIIYALLVVFLVGSLFLFTHSIV